VIQGLWIALLGMALVFFSLGLVMVLIVLLDRAFRQRQAVAEPPAVAASPPVEDVVQDKALAAAIGLAVALARSEHGHRTNTLSRSAAPSAWRLQGRRQQMTSPSQRW